jgi:heat shock protein HtpX
MILITLMGIMLVMLGAMIGLAIFGIGLEQDPPFAGGFLGAGIAFVIWFVMYLSAILSGDKILLSSSRAHKIVKEEAPMLWNVVEEMTLASGLGAMPDVYIIEDDTPNAFAVGRKTQTASVAVTSGLLKRLNRDELQGVVAHEIGHIKNLDVKFMTMASVMLGAIVIISEMFVRSVFYGSHGRRSRSSGNGGGQAQLLIFVVAIFFAVLAPLMAQVLYFACSRKREYLADASAARFTRFPAGLASALEKIASRPGAMKHTNRALAPLYIVNPLAGRSLTRLFSTHPPLEKRVQVLRSMSGAGFAAYEEAFKQVHGGRKHCLGSQTLSSGDRVSSREPSAEPKSKDEAVKRIQDVNDLLTMFGGFIFIPCACGMNLKLPETFTRSTVACPKCGTEHDVPSAKGRPDLSSSSSQPQEMTYTRKGHKWESFKCRCGHTLNLSPAFQGASVRCSKCQTKISVKQ